jgi:hypothetical protein
VLVRPKDRRFTTAYIFPQQVEDDSKPVINLCENGNDLAVLANL